jgi:hypothetical protein
MLQFYLIAVAAGLLSGLLQSSIMLPGAGAMILAYIAPLPLFLVGLGMGLQGAMVAVLVVGVLSIPVAGPAYAAIQVLIYGVPIIVLCRQTLLSRSDGKGVQHWYPAGHLLIWLSGLAMAGLLLTVGVLSLFGDGLIAHVNGVMEPFAAQLPLPEQRELLLAVADFLPAIFAVSWILGLIFNGILAQGLLARFSRNLAPTPKMAEIRLPVAWFGVLALALFLATLEGLIGVVGKTLAAIAIVPYFLLGLGVIHDFVKSWKARWIFLILFYGILLMWPLPVLVAALGFLFAVLRLRGGNDLDNAGDSAEGDK